MLDGSQIALANLCHFARGHQICGANSNLLNLQDDYSPCGNWSGSHRRRKGTVRQEFLLVESMGLNHQGVAAPGDVIRRLDEPSDPFVSGFVVPLINRGLPERDPVKLWIRIPDSS